MMSFNIKCSYDMMYINMTSFSGKSQWKKKKKKKKETQRLSVDSKMKFGLEEMAVR